MRGIDSSLQISSCVSIGGSRASADGKYSEYLIDCVHPSTGAKLASTPHRFSDFAALRRALFGVVGENSAMRAQIEAVPFPRKTLIPMRPIHTARVEERTATLRSWLRAILLIDDPLRLDNCAQVRAFLGEVGAMANKLLAAAQLAEGKGGAAVGSYLKALAHAAGPEMRGGLRASLAMAAELQGAQVADALSDSGVQGGGQPFVAMGAPSGVSKAATLAYLCTSPGEALESEGNRKSVNHASFSRFIKDIAPVNMFAALRDEEQLGRWCDASVRLEGEHLVTQKEGQAAEPLHMQSCRAQRAFDGKYGFSVDRSFGFVVTETEGARAGRRHWFFTGISREERGAYGGGRDERLGSWKGEGYRQMDAWISALARVMRIQQLGVPVHLLQDFAAEHAAEITGKSTAEVVGLVRYGKAVDAYTMRSSGATRSVEPGVVVKATEGCRLSYADAYLRGGTDLAPATAYVVHAWDEPFEMLVEACVNYDRQEDYVQYFFIDVLCCNHWSPAPIDEKSLAQTVSACAEFMGDTPSLLLVLGGWPHGAPPAPAAAPAGGRLEEEDAAQGAGVGGAIRSLSPPATPLDDHPNDPLATPGALPPVLGRLCCLYELQVGARAGAELEVYLHAQGEDALVERMQDGFLLDPELHTREGEELKKFDAQRSVGYGRGELARRISVASAVATSEADEQTVFALLQALPPVVPDMCVPALMGELVAEQRPWMVGLRGLDRADAEVRCRVEASLFRELHQALRPKK